MGSTKAERRKRIAREDAERAREDAERVESDKVEKEWKKATIDTELQVLMVKKAELNTPVEPKTEPVEETAASSSGGADWFPPQGRVFGAG
jgi:predicted phage gp36 major capsid-like protein